MATATRSESMSAGPTADQPVPLDPADDFAPPTDDIRYEVINGTILELPPMGSREIDLANFLCEALTLHVVPQRLGRAFVEPLLRLEKQGKNRRRPDVAFVSAARWPVGKRVPPGNSWQVVPDLAVEVVSPTDSAVDLFRKIGEYFEAGVAAVWVVLPEARQIHAYSSPTEVRILTPPAELDGGEVIPGFRLPLARLFEDDPGLAGT